MCPCSIDADRTAGDELTLLAEADRRFAQSRDTAAIAANLAALVVQKADTCDVYLVTDAVRTPKVVGHATAEGKTRSAGEALPSSEELVATVATTGERQIAEGMALLPLVVQDHILGVVRIEGKLIHPQSDLRVIERLTHRAAIALEHVRLMQAAREARWAAELQAEYAKRLQSVTFGLSHAITARQMGEVVVREARDALGGHVAGIARVCDDGTTLETLAAAGMPEEAFQAIVPGTLTDVRPVATALRERTDLFFESASDWHNTQPGVHALACLPLTLPDGRAVGVFFFGFAHPHRFLTTEREFLQTLAQQLAQVLDRARLYEAEHRMRVAAEQASKIKDEFLSVVSHELRTPLTAILGWVRLLRDPAHGGAKRDHALEVIERNALAQKRIIDDILDVSRFVTGKLQLDLIEIELPQVVRTALEVVRPAADAKGVQLRVRVDAVRPVAGDPERLQQVLWNLLSNAIRFTPRGGSVSIVVEQDDTDVHLVVADDGIGIEPSFLPYVFDRFRQADGSISRRHGGLGLGLAIVRHLVELHGGSVAAQSDGPGLGASFTIRLPMSGGASVGAPVASPPKTAPTLPSEPPPETLASPLDDLRIDGLRILLVEDDSDTQEIFTELLKSRGAVVTSAGSAETALRALDEFEPDVLVSDIGLPGEDGFALLARIRALRSPVANVPAIALTAFAGESDAQRAYAAGFFAHLPKPIDLKKLWATLAGVRRDSPCSAIGGAT